MQRARTRDWLTPGLLAVLLALPTAAAAGSAWGRAEPGQPTAGATVRLLFVVNDSGLLDVGVMRDVKCTVTSPDGVATTPCSGAPELVDAMVSPSIHAYAWDVAAPSAPGVYRVHFERTDLLALPSDGATADATFTIGNGTQDGSSDPVKLGATNGTTGGRAWTVFAFLPGASTPSLPLADHLDAARWLLSLVVGSSTLIVILIAHRLGGRRP
jgi:hypothetical protein